MMSDPKKILAITACPTGIAHTYMAAEKLQEAADELGIELHVETHGSVGVENHFTAQQIREADGLIIAADKQIDLSRFQGLPAVLTRVSEGIHHPKELLEKAPNAPKVSGEKAVRSDGVGEGPGVMGASIGTQIYKALMNGVSHMVPFVVTGGLLIAIALSLGGEPTAEGLIIPEGSIWKTVEAVGALAFTLMVPILSGYIAMAIADRPGLAPGMITGYIAITGELYNSEAGAGFLGAIVTGFAAGYVALLIKKIPVHKYIQPIMPIIVIPILTTVIVSAAFIFLIGHPVASLFEFLTEWLSGMEGASVILLGAILGAMAGFDMGGPVNKTAFLFSGGLIASGNAYPMGMMAAAIAVPPLGMGVATLVRRRWFTKQENESGIAALFMGFFGITEGAIPFAAARPLQVIPANVIGGAVAGGLAGVFAVQDHVLHGGPIVAVLGAVDNVVGYFAAILVGVAVTALVALALMSIQRRRTSASETSQGTPEDDDAEAHSPADPSSIADYLHPEAVILDEPLASQEELIRELASRGAATGQVADVEGVVQAALRRESHGTTAVGDGIAIPHAKTDAVSSPFIGFARVAKGMDWNASDGKPASLVFLIGVPESQAGDEHLKILAQLSRTLMRKQVRTELESADSPEAARTILSESVPA